MKLLKDIGIFLAIKRNNEIFIINILPWRYGMRYAALNTTNTLKYPPLSP